MKYSLHDNEETLKNNVRRDFFSEFDSTQCFNNIDFSVAIKEEGTFQLDEREYLLWAESKAGNKHKAIDSLVQLILTIGKAKTLDNNLPPHFLGAFDAEKIAFIPFHAVMQVFNQNDFNWNVTPSDHSTKEFQQLHLLVKNEIDKHAANDGQVYIFQFDEDEKELRRFIRTNFVSGRDKIQRISVNQNNFVAIFQKWRREVMPTINIDWDNAKKFNILEADFFLADLIAKNNLTLLDKLHVLLQGTHYELDRKIGADNLFSSKTVQFKKDMQAHAHFWNRYARPPKEAYWDKIVERRDLLVPQDVRERKGSYFTPAQWVELSQQYIAEVLGDNWQDEYYIWDCCAGTGNLLAGLTNKYNIFASTLDQADVRVMLERIEKMGDGSNLLPSHIFQFDFLNDDFNDPKLPPSLRDILTDPNKRQKLIIYINPPYAEAGDIKQIAGTGKNKEGVANNTMIYKTYKREIGKAAVELFAQFFIRIYREIEGATLAEFSKLKILQASNFADFRRVFQAKLEKLFIVPASTFDNVKGQFPIGFFIWNTQVQETFKSITIDVYDRNGIPLPPKTITCNDDNKNIGKWISEQKDKSNNSLVLGMMNSGRLDFQNQKFVYIANEVSDKSHALTLTLTLKNLIPAVVFLSVRHAIEATWLNDRDQFLYPNDGWKTDYQFQADCLAFTLFHGQNHISHAVGDAGAIARGKDAGTHNYINHWIPFSEQELDSPDRFQSHFMYHFIHQPIQTIQTTTTEQPNLFNNNADNPIADAGDSPAGFAHDENNAQPNSLADAFSPAALEVFDAARKLWRYYLHFPESPDAPFGSNIDVNASFYDIRRFFQGVDNKGKMNSDSENQTYMQLIHELRDKQKILAKQIQPKIYQYAFLK